MPLRQTIDHANRLVVGIGSGEVTLADLATFTREIVRGGLLHYCKLIDITGSTPGFTSEGLSAFAQALREIPCDTPRGALAVVSDPNRGEFARIFANFDVDGRPTKVFRSIHEARAWLTGQMEGNDWHPALRR